MSKGWTKLRPVVKFTNLAFRNKDGNRMVMGAGSEGVVRSTLNPELVPHLDEVVALVELDLVGDEASTVLLVGGVLKIPPTLLLLDKPSQRLLVSSINAFLDDAPDL